MNTLSGDKYSSITPYFNNNYTWGYLLSYFATDASIAGKVDADLYYHVSNRLARVIDKSFVKKLR